LVFLLIIILIETKVKISQLYLISQIVVIVHRILAQSSAKFGPWPGAQFLRIVQKPDSDGNCNAVAEIIANGVIKASYAKTARVQSPGNAAYHFKILHIIPGPYAQLSCYGWTTGGIGDGVSDYQIYAYQNGAMRRVFYAGEWSGDLSIKIKKNGLTIAGFRTTKCMACGYNATASWIWSPGFGGWLLVDATPRSVDFARYLSAPTVVARGDDASEYTQALAEYQRLYKELGNRYETLMQQANPTQKNKLKTLEIQWIKKKEKECGSTTFALQKGNGAALECLIGETRDRLQGLSYDLSIILSL
jgi:uncharacterized protein YecT (DUF1311 family)